MLDMADFVIFEEEISRIYAELETNLLEYVVHMIMKGDLPADPNTWAVRKLDNMMNLQGRLRQEISRLMQEHGHRIRCGRARYSQYQADRRSMGSLRQRQDMVQQEDYAG